MSSVGLWALAGAFSGWVLVTVAMGVLTGGNLSGLIGLIFGLPLGAAVGIIAACASVQDVRRFDKVIWVTVAMALIFLVAAFVAISFIHGSNS